MIPGIVKDSGLGCQPDGRRQSRRPILAGICPGYLISQKQLLPNLRVSVRHYRLRRLAPGRAARLGGNVRNRRRWL